MSLCSLSDWQRAIDGGARYHVVVCWATYRPECPADVVDTEHTFGSRARAEAFARAIARRLPTGKTADGCPLVWVLVSALAVTSGDAVSYGPLHCYFSLDPGAVVVKRFEIERGYYGAGSVHPMSPARRTEGRSCTVAPSRDDDWAGVQDCSDSADFM